MPRLNSASLWRNTTDISVQILYHLPRKECKSFSIFFCFASVNFDLRFRAFFDVRGSGSFSRYFRCFARSNSNFLTFFYRFRYCNSHLQVLGIVPKKIRRKKPGDGVENGVNSSSTTSESKARTDVLLTTPASTNMPSIPPQLFPFRLKKPRNQPQKRAYTNIPAIEELRESRKKWQKDRTDLFKIYGKNLQNFWLSLGYWCNRHAISCFCTE